MTHNFKFLHYRPGFINA